MRFLSSMRLLLILFGFLLPLQSYAIVYSANSVEGWVVDEETGKPIEGVIVVAHWQLQGGIESYPVGELHIYEAVTDTAGRYFIPSWGPKVSLFGRLKSDSPGIFFFKPGYSYRGVSNTYVAGMGTSKSEWDKKTVQFARSHAGLDEYARSLDTLNNGLWVVGHVGGEPCGWESFPRMLRALASVDAQLQSTGTRAPYTVYSRLKVNQQNLSAAGCRPFDEVVRP